MAKRTAIIDIGSNSVRLVIFEKTSRFAFHLIHQLRSRVRISENAYQNNGYLQEVPLERAYKALKEFSFIIKDYQVRKTLCVATSALRDAPNKKDFISKIKKDLNLNIKIIDGKEEAYLGGLSVANLLHLDSALSIDIGGGSTELALYTDKKVIETYSLDLGTVRLKELYFDKGNSEGAIQHINQELLKLPQDLRHENIVGIGGTLRAISKMIMQKENPSYQRLHGYCFQLAEQEDYINSIINATQDEL
ncbi:MAG TPA: Ppx/GppA family phosphatase, partial [Sulfurimonas sp.]|nr:Ppx/GppA family phosphatase [Sulfurimonas sp.]